LKAATRASITETMRVELAEPDEFVIESVMVFEPAVV
jgi:hypothetical protein